MSKPERVSGYTQRNRTSSPVPLGLKYMTSSMIYIYLCPEIDSDSDFNPGVYVPEPVQKRKRDSASAASTARKKGKRSVAISGSPTKRARLQRRCIDLDELNPLLQYLAEENLDLHSASEGSDDDDDDNGNEPGDMQDEREEDEEDEEDKSEEEERISSKTFFGATKKDLETSPLLSFASTKLAAARDVKPEDDGSVTESDSEADDGVPMMPVHIMAQTSLNKPLPKQDQGSEESVTEPESDGEEFMTISGAAKVETSGSETESDDEYELGDPRLKPRPGFPLREDQTHLGPLYLDAEKQIAVPAVINTYLRDYQRDGVQFFYRQYAEGRGGLLGDDMGLYHRVISFLSAIMQKNGVVTDKNRRRKHVSRLQDEEAWKKRRELPSADATWPTCLIIAPSTVVHNWQREFHTWGYFEVGMYNGTRKEREPVLNDFKMGRLDIVLTSFDLARKDIDILDTLPWTCIFVDEVHRVKNVSSKITLAYHQFACERRFGLTGTTIQNSYKEMWTILDWTNPGRLGTARQWQGFIVKPLTAGQSAGATEDERAKALVVALVLRDKLLPKFFLRRTKDIISSQLPKKTDEVVFCPLTLRQIAVYKQILNMTPVQNLIHRDDPCTCGSRKSRKNCCGMVVPGDVFKYMSILIKLSNHLALILPSPTDSPEQVVRNRALAELAFPDGDIPKYGTAMMQPNFCGKWAILELLLKEWRKDQSNKVLIFTKSVKLLEMLEFHLKSRGLGFLKLDGATRQSDRMPMIDQFHTDPDIFIFLISTLAGGTGLNLTGANKVVIFGMYTGI
ncbi:hypothetical protein H2248_002670 [Termitomyces sp. 'cryptogamus']|nr:hypothetical protein H2248_002670 [Termitomyces sp. 'cryptogamus']